VKRKCRRSRDVFLQSLKAREPMGGIPVDIWRATAFLPPAAPQARMARDISVLGKPAREKEPVAIVARKRSDVRSIPYCAG